MERKNERLYTIWRLMRQRCKNPNRHDYKYYGGRGVDTCQEWDDYLVFKEWALKNGYTDELTIERINNDGDYSPNNCKWITFAEQRNNTSQSVLVEIAGRKQTLKQWCAELGISYYAVCQRTHRGMDVKDALIIPMRKGKPCKTG